MSHLARGVSRVIPTASRMPRIASRIIQVWQTIAAAVASGHIQLIGAYPTARANTSFVPTAIIANKKIGPGPKLAYSKLLTYALTNEPATNNRLADDLAVSPRSVRNYIAALKSAGLIKVRLHPGKPNSYALARAV